MANTAQARKRARQAETHRQRNTAQRSEMRTYVKKVVKAIDAKDKEAAEATYKQTIAVVDSAVSKGLIHKNKAARHKSRLNSRIRAMQ